MAVKALLNTFEEQLSRLTKVSLKKYPGSLTEQYKKLGEDVGVSVMTVSRWKNGSVGYISDEPREKLRNYLSCSNTDLQMYFEGLIPLENLLNSGEKRKHDVIEKLLLELEDLSTHEILTLMERIPRVLAFKTGGEIMKALRLQQRIRSILSEELNYPERVELTLEQVEALLPYFCIHTPAQRIWLLDFLNGKETKINIAWIHVLSQGVIALTGDKNYTIEWFLSICKY